LTIALIPNNVVDEDSNEDEYADIFAPLVDEEAADDEGNNGEKQGNG
jgi:hypothetical protein